MKQFLVPDNARWEKTEEHTCLFLSGGDFHYLANVLRYRQGYSFPGIDKSGNRYLLSVIAIFRDSIQLSAQKEHTSLKNNIPDIHLFQCLPKGKKMDTIIRQATESGVAGIVPIISQYSISRPEEFRGKMARWQKIAAEATQQSGREKLPYISEPKNLFDSAEEFGKVSTGLFFHQTPLENSSLHGYLCNISHNPENQGIGIAIGPEGGFSEKEIDFFTGLGYLAVYLGPWILRTETAPVYAIGAVQTIVRESDSWQLIKEQDC